MNHFARGRRGQGGHQRIEAADPQRVDAPDLTAGRQLQQAEFGKEGAFAKEFRIESDPRLRLQRPRPPGCPCGGARAGSSSSRSIQIASGISLIRVYNLASMMTESDDAATRK